MAEYYAIKTGPGNRWTLFVKRGKGKARVTSDTLRAIVALLRRKGHVKVLSSFVGGTMLLGASRAPRGQRRDRIQFKVGY